jgi:hypothetical protein
MCMQCVTEAVRHGEPFPGFSLYRATKTDEGWFPVGRWEAGQWGLVEMNDPSFLFTVPFMKDPFAGMSDEQIDALPNFRELMEEHEKAATAIDRDIMAGGAICGETVGSPLVVYRLITAATKVGYKPDEDGGFGYWVSDYLARWVETHPLPDVENIEETPASAETAE